MSIRESFYKFCPNCKSALIRKEVDGVNRLACENCGFIFWNNPVPVVSVIILRDNKILMLKRGNEPFKGWWVLPGGNMNVEETPEKSIKRETKEETGLNTELRSLIGVYRIDDDPRGINIDIIYKADGFGEIKLSSEDTEYKFFDVNNLPDKIAYKHRSAIIDSQK